MSTEKSEYFKGWYAANGRRLNTTRRDRYSTDPAYRDKVLLQNREARKKKRAENKKERLAKKEALKVRPSRAWRAVSVEVNGKLVKMFTIGAVAKALDCSVQALRLWERKGVLTETPHRYSKGDRLYTLGQIERLRVSLTEQGRIGQGKVRVKVAPFAERKVLFKGRTRARKTRLYRIGTMAQIVGRTVVTLEQLEQKGLLPETPFRVSEAGHRLYTVGMMKAVKEAFDRQGGEIRGEEAWSVFHSEVLTSWAAMGIIGANIVEDE